MDLSLEPELYSPSINSTGEYVDVVPSQSQIKHGLRCPCGSRGQKAYVSNSFSNHIKTQHHQKWLQQLNTNKTNHFTENVQLKDTIHNQQLIISKMEKEINHKNWMVQYLSSQLQAHLTNTPIINSISEFD